MKTAIIIFVFLIVIAFILVSSNQSDRTTTSVGSIDDIGNYIEKIIKSGNKYAILIATIHGSSDFIQFTANEKGAQIDFPLITDRQKSMEALFRSVVKELNLEIVENRGSNGQSFLDVNIEGSAAEIAFIVKRIMEGLFKVNQDTKIEYKMSAPNK